MADTVVLYPYTAPRTLRATRCAARLSGCDFRAARLDEDDTTAYAQVLAWEWESDRGLIVVEHDIVATAGVLMSMTACPEPWCVAPYFVGSHVTRESMGCVKFGLGMRRYVGEAVRLDLLHGYPDAKPLHWRAVSEFVGRQLRGHGYSPCSAHPQVEHLHDYTTAGR